MVRAARARVEFRAAVAPGREALARAAGRVRAPRDSGKVVLAALALEVAEGRAAVVRVREARVLGLVLARVPAGREARAEVQALPGKREPREAGRAEARVLEAVAGQREVREPAEAEKHCRRENGSRLRRFCVAADLVRWAAGLGPWSAHRARGMPVASALQKKTFAPC